MKKFALIGLMSVLFISMSFGQGDPKKALKRAKKDLAAYNLDQKNYAKLEEAKKMIDFAAADAEYGKMSKTWNLKGEIYNALTSNVQIQRITNPGFKNPNPQASVIAYEAFKKGLEFAEKKYHKSDALKGISESLSGISDMGINAYGAGDFKAAYEAFSKGLEIHKLLTANGKKSPLDKKEQYQNQLYITGLAALNSNNLEVAGQLLGELKSAGFNKPTVYDGLYKVAIAKGDDAGAAAILAEGREKFPEDKALMYSEINSYLKSGKMAELVSKLGDAIKSDPENASLHATLGTVYDRLSTDATEANNEAEASKNFALAKASYEKALALDPENFAAVYSIGALYYNKAAAYTKQLKDLENDMSKAGMKKFDATKADMQKVFDEALPYFLKADKMNSKDASTLTALKEIYARKNDLVKSKEYSDRLNAL